MGKQGDLRVDRRGVGTAALLALHFYVRSSDLDPEDYSHRPIANQLGGYGAPKVSAASSTMWAPMAREDVAPGDGALRT